MWCLHIQKEKRTTAASPTMGTSEYSMVLKSCGFCGKGLEVAVGGQNNRG